MTGPLLLPYEGTTPVLAEGAWVAPGATLVGAVTLRARASVWYGSVLRADGDAVTVGEASNIQDGCVVHADPGYPVQIGAGVSVGHRAVVHGCTVEDDCLVGMGCVLLNGVTVGRGSLLAAGTVLLEGTEVPPGSLVAGVPGTVRRELDDEDAERIHGNAQRYLQRVPQHAAITLPGDDLGR